MNPILSNSRLRPLLALLVLALAFWSRVLFTGRVLLPGEMLRGFLPFGSSPDASWTILQWDSLAQYFPWRHFAAQSLHVGKIPLWNPYQFSGTPFLANAQSAAFYPLNLPFWIFDPAYAFGIAAFEHTLLALLGTFVLGRSWGMSRAAAIVAATAYAFCGYLAAWALLPTLFATASWLPLCLWLYEKAADDAKPAASSLGLALALCCALLAGHAQIFFYLVLALLLRQPLLQRKWRGIALLAGTGGLTLALGAAQLLPTLELAGRGHRAGVGPSDGGWTTFWLPRALQPTELVSLVDRTWPMAWGTLNENFGYVGVGVVILSLLGLALRDKPQRFFALALAVFGLLYATATPLAKFFYFNAPGVSQMGGSGRALLLWSLGAALLAGFGVDWLRTRIKSPLVPLVALLVVGTELFGNAWATQPTAPRAQIYPPTALTTWLQSHSDRQNRVLFFTSQQGWLASEGFRPPRIHPEGVLPPNGATVYGIYDVNGYDSLSPRVYRDYIGSDAPISPPLNGNMVLLNNLRSDVLDALSVRYIVVPQAQDLTDNTPRGQIVFPADGCNVWERPLPNGVAHVSGEAFYPGWKAGGYQPETFRFGVFVSLCALGFVAAGLSFKVRCLKHSDTIAADSPTTS